MIDDTQHHKYLRLLNNYNDDLAREVQRKTEYVNRLQERMVLGMADIIENRDTNTGGHVKRTSEVIRIFTEELKKYGSNLAKKPKIFVATKMDEEGAEERLAEFKKKSGIEDVISISAIMDNNIDKLLYKIADLIDEENEKVEEVEEVEYKVYDATQTMDKEIFNIRRIKSNTYQIYGESVERTFNLINISTDEGMMKLISYLRKIGVDDRLHEMGAKDGDIVTLCDFEFEYFE